MTVTAATAARIARVSVATVRAWCRHGAVAAVKTGGRWVVDVASLRARIGSPLRRPADRLRKGRQRPVLSGRAARTRVGSHMSVQRRYAVLDALVRRTNAGKVTTAQYLADVVGADADFVRRFAAPYGKAVAKAYRDEYGAEPSKSGLARRGRMLLSCFAYGADDLPVLDKGARTYRRTAELLGA